LKNLAKRGGKRPNAGRKLTLDHPLRWDIGGYCERRWQMARETKAKRQLGNHKILPDRLAEKRAILKNRAELTKRAVSSSEYEKAGDKIFGKRKRLYTFKTSRPYGRGVKDQIIHDAVSYAFKEHGLKLTPRMIVRIWNEVRALQKRLDADKD
jgi:hypothetical protein